MSCERTFPEARCAFPLRISGSRASRRRLDVLASFLNPLTAAGIFAGGRDGWGEEGDGGRAKKDEKEDEGEGVIAPHRT